MLVITMTSLYKVSAWQHPHLFTLVQMFILAFALYPKLFSVAAMPLPTFHSVWVCSHLRDTRVLFFWFVTNARVSVTAAINSNSVMTVAVAVAPLFSQSAGEFRGFLRGRFGEIELSKVKALSTGYLCCARRVLAAIIQVTKIAILQVYSSDVVVCSILKTASQNVPD